MNLSYRGWLGTPFASQFFRWVPVEALTDVRLPPRLTNLQRLQHRFPPRLVSLGCRQESLQSALDSFTFSLGLWA